MSGGMSAAVQLTNATGHPGTLICGTAQRCVSAHRLRGSREVLVRGRRRELSQHDAQVGASGGGWLVRQESIRIDGSRAGSAVRRARAPTDAGVVECPQRPRSLFAAFHTALAYGLPAIRTIDGARQHQQRRRGQEENRLCNHPPCPPRHGEHPTDPYREPPHRLRPHRIRRPGLEDAV